MVIQNSITFSKFSPWVFFFHTVYLEISTLVKIIGVKKSQNFLKRVNPQKYFFGHIRNKLRNISLAPFAPVQPSTLKFKTPKAVFATFDFLQFSLRYYIEDIFINNKMQYGYHIILYCWQYTLIYFKTQKTPREANLPLWTRLLLKSEWELKIKMQGTKIRILSPGMLDVYERTNRARLIFKRVLSRYRPFCKFQ